MSTRLVIPLRTRETADRKRGPLQCSQTPSLGLDVGLAVDRVIVPRDGVRQATQLACPGTTLTGAL